MTKEILFLFAVFCSVIVSSVILAEEVKPANIDSLKLQQADVPNAFVLYQESLSKPGPSTGEAISQEWRRKTSEQELVLVEERKDKADYPVEGFVRQIWYRGEKKGEKDKIEVVVIICATQEQMEKTISHFTTEAFAIPFRITESPFAGERSWTPVDENPRGDSFSVMFARSNVFVRLYVRLRGVSEEGLLQVAKGLGSKIDKKIEDFF